MLTRVTKHTAQFCARLFICLLLLVPSALSYAVPANGSLASLMCSPSGQSLSPEAASNLAELAELLGETSEETETRNSHCDVCTLSFVVLPSPMQSVSCPALGKGEASYVGYEIGLVHKAQGPPTGSRAPPFFI